MSVYENEPETRGWLYHPWRCMKTNVSMRVSRGDVAGALRKFKKKVEREGVMAAIRQHEYFMKPSERRRNAKAKGIRRRRKLGSLNLSEFVAA
jgi:ribosomal protein S21